MKTKIIVEEKKMSEKLSKEVNEKIAGFVKEQSAKEAGPIVLTDADLGGVTGGVDSYSFDIDGYVIVAVCNHPSTIQGVHMSYSLINNTSCVHAPGGTPTCFDCKHFSAWRTAKTANV